MEFSIKNVSLFRSIIPMGIIVAVWIYLSAIVGCIISDSGEKDLPYPKSNIVEGILWDFDNMLQLAPGSDLWPATWGPDNNIYVSWGDGGGFGGTNSDGRVSIGFGLIKGIPPGFEGINLSGGKNASYPVNIHGKCAGMLYVNNIIYAWLNLKNSDPPDIRLAWSSDFCRTWQISEWKFPEDDFFPATFLNFGQNYEGARDDYIYFYGGPWGFGINHYLARAKISKLQNKDSYEYFEGIRSDGTVNWTREIKSRKPIMVDKNGIRNIVSIIYNKGIRRYIATTSHGDVGQLSVFDGPEPWGPWTTVAYYNKWGKFTKGESLAYVFPTKWISSDGKTMWMIFSSTKKLDSYNLVKATLSLTKP